MGLPVGTDADFSTHQRPSPTGSRVAAIPVHPRDQPVDRVPPHTAPASPHSAEPRHVSRRAQQRASWQDLRGPAAWMAVQCAIGMMVLERLLTTVMYISLDQMAWTPAQSAINAISSTLMLVAVGTWWVTYRPQTRQRGFWLPIVWSRDWCGWLLVAGGMGLQGILVATRGQHPIQREVVEAAGWLVTLVGVAVVCRRLHSLSRRGGEAGGQRWFRELLCSSGLLAATIGLVSLQVARILVYDVRKAPTAVLLTLFLLIVAAAIGVTRRWGRRRFDTGWQTILGAHLGALWLLLVAIQPNLTTDHLSAFQVAAYLAMVSLIAILRLAIESLEQRRLLGMIQK